MAQGAQVKALIIMSKNQGWDPTRIWDAKTQKYGDSIENFNKAPRVLENQAGTGKLPQGTPDSFPGDHPPIPAWDSEQAAPWNHATQNVNRDLLDPSKPPAAPKPRRPGGKS